MIILGGKDPWALAYALTKPPMGGSDPAPEFTRFGFLPDLARWAYQSMPIESRHITEDADGVMRSHIPDDEIRAMGEALLDLHINVFGFKLAEAQHQVLPEAARVIPLEDIEDLVTECPDIDKWMVELAHDPAYLYEEDTAELHRAVREYAIRDALEHSNLSLSVRHDLLDLLVEQDRDLHNNPALVEQIHCQLDEEG